MVTDQQKKRLKAASIVSCNLQEQYWAKEKSLVSPKNVLNMRSHIFLEWDDNQKRAVAKREQIGITWRDVAPFIDHVSHCHPSLADVFAIPQDIFELENLNGVLSYEVWETHLSERERNLLTQFLPRGTNAPKVVQALLKGENLHFGNPFLKWQVMILLSPESDLSASLCSGNLHPDAVLRQEHIFKASKIAYYFELQKYHNDIVKNLQKWKERWASCKDPENEIVQNMWSPLPFGLFMDNYVPFSTSSPVSSPSPTSMVHNNFEADIVDIDNSLLVDSHKRFRFSLVGWFLADQQLNRPAALVSIINAWRSRGSVHCTELA
ncbi:hypothetical protein HHK36_007676 [Tetracentron sinense]|uniref:DEUBAD domain-containing protein n=1 Tax=Tetracentron sinense TaxID=13715 RepID=A0A834ZN11_TETSI|nr:hypothetical protein HHK36_007676 [Tetracentron sinense]